MSAPTPIDRRSNRLAKNATSKGARAQPTNAGTPTSEADRSGLTRADLHTISLLVRDAPGVLVRVAMVFSRRGYNIESLVVSSGAKPGFSRMTVTCSGDPGILEQMTKQLAKLIDVVHVVDHTLSNRFETEIALLKIRCSGDERREVLEVAEHFAAKVVDYGADSLILRVYGGSEKLDAMISLFVEDDIVEIVRSGKIVMARGLDTT